MSIFKPGKKISPPRQRYARTMIKASIQADGDPFGWELFKDDANYNLFQLRAMRAHALNGRSNDPTLPEDRRQLLRDKAEKELESLRIEERANRNK